MSAATVRLIAAAIILVATTLLYTHRLGDTPAYLSLDEAHIANQAYSLATTGRTLNGERLPVFISLEDPLGEHYTLPWGATRYHPVGFYLVASALLVAPLSEWSVRSPFAIAAVLNIVLVYLLAHRWYGSRWVAGAAAALLTMTPAHFILSRMTLDYLLPVTFVLAWLLSLSHLTAKPRRRTAVITGAVLGAGCFSFVSSWVMMPIYAAISAAVIAFHLRRRDLVVPLAAGFAAALGPLVWLAWHPEVPANLIRQYQAGEGRPSVLSAIAVGGGVGEALKNTLAVYWSYFDPSFLFVTGGASRMVSTGLIGVWPVGMAALLLLGVVPMVRGERRIETLVALAGLLLAPLPAAMKGEPFAIHRAVTLLPFGVLLAAAGLRSLDRRRPLAAAAIVVATISCGAQFTGFVRDYFAGQRLRSAHAMDPTAFRETASVLLAAGGDAPAIVLPAGLYDISAKWRFYCTKAAREDLLQRTRYLDGGPADPQTLERGALVVRETASAPAAGWRTVATPVDITGASPLTILRRE
ncbi:MAG TPA: glycosyltransferase family 39 protein [Vicinamibacterales bacterium]|nr:glycosyltransferase family 39 protein [Vicinamibacterales bacterium]